VPFTSKMILERVSGTKRYKLLNYRFTIEGRDGVVEMERFLSSAAKLGRTLEETFQIMPPAPADLIFSRIGKID
jgi:arylamine N-acetyltransferase